MRAGRDMNYGYFHVGLYAQQVETFLQYFDKSRFLFLLFDELRADPRAVSRAVFRFLEVNDSVQVHLSTRRNAAGRPRSKRVQAFLTQERFVKTRLRPLKRILPPQVSHRLSYYFIGKNTAPFRYPPMPEEIEKLLRARYREDVLRLQTLIGRDLSHWLPSDGSYHQLETGQRNIMPRSVSCARRMELGVSRMKGVDEGP